MELYLIRHAQSINNARPEPDRVEDPALTELGHMQASKTAAWLQSAGLSRLVTSPFRRTLETTEHIRRAVGLGPEVWVDLHEQGGCQSGGAVEQYQGRPGMTGEQIRAEFPHSQLEPGIDGDGWWRSQPYETAEQARQRAWSLARRTIEAFAHSEERVAYVTHGTFKGMFVQCLVGGLNLAPHLHGNIYNSSVSRFVITPDAVRIDFYNAIGHLPLAIVT